MVFKYYFIRIFYFILKFLIESTRTDNLSMKTSICKSHINKIFLRVNEKCFEILGEIMSSRVSCYLVRCQHQNVLLSSCSRKKMLCTVIGTVSWHPALFFKIFTILFY